MIFILRKGCQPGAPHYGEMFDADYIREDIFKYLAKYMK
jgi:hypothetical protein